MFLLTDARDEYRVGLSFWGALDLFASRMCTETGIRGMLTDREVQIADAGTPTQHISIFILPSSLAAYVARDSKKDNQIVLWREVFRVQAPDYGKSFAAMDVERTFQEFLA